MWLYSLKNTVRNKDYNSIYNELQGNITSKIFYNTSVYDFEAWGPKDIYNYIYILVMIIGVASPYLSGYRLSAWQKQIL